MSYLNSFKIEISKKMKNKNKQKNVEDNQERENKETINAIDNKSNIKSIISDDKAIVNNDNNENAKMVTKNNQKQNNNDNIKVVTGALDLTPSRDDDPEAKLKELDDRYELLEFYDAPSSLGLKEKEIPVYDKDKIESEIRKQKGEEYNIKKEDKKSDFERDYDDLISLEKDAKQSYSDNKNEINEVYDSESLAVESQAIKRGLARSSIVLGQLASVENERANKLLQEYDTYNNKLADIESELQENKIKYEQALESLDIEMAEEIESEIQKSYNEYKKALDEAIEFNNEVKRLEAEYKLDYEKAKAEHKEQILDLTQYGYDEYRKKLEISKYNYMISYLSQFSKNEAYEIFFGNNNFKELLGNNYSKVVEYLYNRI